ncbi:hypothetical protein GIB67_001161, partial [Kingdonia uniflora]
FWVPIMSSPNVAEGSEASTGQYRPANSIDPGWNYGQPGNGNKDHVKCNFCGYVSKGGGRLRGKQKATKEKQNKKDEMIRNVNVYRNDDEAEEVGIQIPKRKELMDAFAACIDVNFRPKAPTSNENKKALEHIHGCIADFFYENIISFNCARSDSYSKMMQAIVQYNDPSSNYGKQMERIIDRRSSTLLKKPLHAAAHYHNPQYYYATLTSSYEMESNAKLKESLLDYITKLAFDEKDESQILRDLIVYRTKAGRLGKRGAQTCVKTIVLGTDITYGVLEDAEDGLDDPPLTRTSRTNTALQGGTSSSRSTTRHLQDSSDDDDYDVDATYDVGNGDDDDIDSGSDEDI